MFTLLALLFLFDPMAAMDRHEHYFLLPLANFENSNLSLRPFYLNVTHILILQALMSLVPVPYNNVSHITFAIVRSYSTCSTLQI